MKPQAFWQEHKALGYSYPLRDDFLAELVLPKNLTADEADRLKAFIDTLVVAKRLGV